MGNKPTKILVVDDYEGMLEIMVMGLEMEGFQVVSTSDEGMIMQIIQDERPDIILMDFILNVRNGCELCSEIKSNENFNSIRVFLMSADSRLKNNYKTCGADDFLEKPFEFTTLIEKIRMNHSFTQG